MQNKRFLFSLLAAMFCLLTASAQGKYPNGYFQSTEDYENIVAEATIFSKKAKGRAKEYPTMVCNGELNIESDNGYTEYYVLTYTGTKQALGYVFKVLLQDSDMLEIEGKVAIKRTTGNNIVITAISPNLKNRTINKFKMIQCFPGNVEIP